MAQRQNPRRPALEILEDRTVPATYRLLSGSLFISNPTGALAITATGGTSVQVQDGAGPLLNFSGVGNVNVTGTNLANNITFNANSAYNGNLFVNGGNGNDTVTLQGTSSIGGNVTLQNGFGTDTILIGNGTALVVRGNISITDANNNGTNDRVTFNSTAATTAFLGTTTINGFNRATFTDGDFGGSVTINSATESANGNFHVDTNPVAFGRDFTVNGGAGNDSVDLRRATVSGNVAANLGEAISATGNNLVLGNVAGVTGTFLGNVTQTGGSGRDNFLIGTGTTVDGNVSLSLGEGINALIVNRAFTVGGDFTIQGGNGTTDASFGSTPGAVIGGNLRYQVGNGDNAFTLESTSVGGNVEVIAGSGNNLFSLNNNTTIGGTYRVRTGNGNNTLNFGSVAFTAPVLFNLDVVFGGDDDTVTVVAGSSAFVSLTGLLDGGAGTDTFTQNSATLLPTLTLANFP